MYRIALATSCLLFETSVALAGGQVPDRAPDLQGDIIVTAQKRGESLYDVPISIAATTGDALRNREIRSADELVKIAPDMRVTAPFGPFGRTFTIRGIGPANQYNFNVQQPVGQYMDELYQTFSAAPGLQMFDLERVELLKGPQGTLFGRNTTGGAINLITRNPSLGEANGYIRASYGNFDSYTAEGAVEATLVPGTLGLRVALYRAETDGFMKNIGDVGPNRIGGGKTTQGRMTLRFERGDFDATLKAYINDYSGEQPGSLLFLPPGETNAGGYSSAHRKNDETEISYYRPTSSESQQISLTMNADMTSDFTVTSITQAQWSKAKVSNDCDASPIDMCRSPYNMEGAQFSQDLRANYRAGPLDLIVGGFYGYDNFEQRAMIAFPPTFIDNFYRQDRYTYGMFADATYALTDQLSLSVGLRQTFDETRLSRVQTVLLDDHFGNPIGQTIPAGPYAPDNFLPATTETSDGLSGRAILMFRPRDRQMYYASYTHGYRTGAFNGLQFFSVDEVNYVAPEKVDNFEAGAKIRFDNGMDFSAAAFFTRIRNQQILTAFNRPACPTCNPPVPAAQYSGLGGLDGRVIGAEAEITAPILPQLRGYLSVNYLNTRYDRGDGQDVSGVYVGGNRFAFVSEWSGLAGLEWTAWQRNEDAVILDVNAAYTGHFYFNPANERGLDPRGRLARGQPGYALVDASIRYEGEIFTLSVWSKNLTDKFYLVTVNDIENSFGGNFAFRGEPRTFGVSVGARF